MNKIHESWKEIFEKYNFILEQELIIKQNHQMMELNNAFPHIDQIFRVFEMNVHDIQIVLLGQDPYHNPGQANGLSFSVNNGISIPPSLKNIFKEIQNEFPERNYVFSTGNIERWFLEEKIFLLNASLTVEKNKPSSHMKYWESFTNDVIQFISQKNNACIFVLLGNFAKSKQEFIDNKENIIYCVHPSPFSANKGFFGSQIFQKIEEKIGRTMNWNT